MAAGALLAALLSLSGTALAGDDYGTLAGTLAEAARRSGARRVAVAPLEAIGGPDAHGTAAVGERVLSRLAAQPGLQVVERALLDRVLAEQRLAQSGAVAPQDVVLLGRLMGVDAIVTGSLIRGSGRKVEVNLRLIHAADARVLGAASAQVRPDWPQGSGLSDQLPAPPPPRLDMDFTPFWERRPAAASCARWEERVDALQQAALPFKVRLWASRLASGYDLRSVTRNPGSEIRSLQTRAAFYNGVKAALAEGDIETLSAQEDAALKQAERTAQGLLELCDR